MQAFCLCASILFSRLHTRNSFYLLTYTRVIRPPVTIFCVRIYPYLSVCIDVTRPRYLPICIHVTRLLVYMLLAYPYVCHYLSIRRHRDTAREKPRNASRLGCGTLPGRGAAAHRGPRGCQPGRSRTGRRGARRAGVPASHPLLPAASGLEVSEMVCTSSRCLADSREERACPDASAVAMASAGWW